MGKTGKLENSGKSRIQRYFAVKSNKENGIVATRERGFESLRPALAPLSAVPAPTSPRKPFVVSSRSRVVSPWTVPAFLQSEGDLFQGLERRKAGRLLTSGAIELWRQGYPMLIWGRQNAPGHRTRPMRPRMFWTGLESDQQRHLCQ